jgi:hypothetical protein
MRTYTRRIFSEQPELGFPIATSSYCLSLTMSIAHCFRFILQGTLAYRQSHSVAHWAYDLGMR